MALAIPPFRADQVGSLLRSKKLAEARAQRKKNELTAPELKAIEDEEIRLLISKQEEVGLQAITDGEYRRAWWHFDFFELLDGIEPFVAEHGIQFRGVRTKARGIKVTGKLGASSPPMLEHLPVSSTMRSPRSPRTW